MPAGGVNTDGWRALKRQLRAAGDDLTDLRDSNKKAAQIAADTIKRLTPSRSGALAKTIRASGTKSAGVVRAGNNGKVRYAGPIVWGWGRRHIAANPFMSRGARQSEPRWTAVYEDYISQIIAKITGR